MFGLDLDACLTEHGSTLQVSVDDAELKRVFAVLGLRVKLKVHGLLNQRKQDSRQYVDVASLSCQMQWLDSIFPILLWVGSEEEQGFNDLAI